ncbi:MAG: hypothetical protein COB51_09920 [Moraxellaceae bacterium]|nr:MAG: hypothetical protein COB51_09920 [Moraxellaceae bacterium]
MKPSEIFLRTLLILCNISFSTLAFSKGEALPQESNTATPQTTEQLLTISPGLERYSIGPYSYAIEDPSRSLKINDLLKIPSSEWQIIDRSTLSLGFNKSPHWFKTTIKSVSSTQSEWIYRLEYPPLDFVDFFVIRENTIISHQISGDHVAVEKQTSNHRAHLFKIQVPKNEKVDIYVRISTQSALQFSAQLLSTSAHINIGRNNQLLAGLFFGMLILLFFYHTLFFLQIKDPRYLGYLIYLGGFIGFQLLVTDEVAEHFITEDRSRVNEFILISISICAIGMLFLSKTFLELKSTDPTLNLLHNVGIAAYLALPVYSALADYRHSIILVTGMTLAFAGLLLLSGALRLLKGFKPARYYMIGWSFFIIGLLVYTFQTLGLIASTTLTHYAIQIGSLFGMISLSLALTDRISILSSNAHHLQNKHVLTLQSEVDIKTQQLQKITQEAEKSKHIAEREHDKSEQANRTNGQFLANMSHEIRTPMNGVLGLVDILSDTKLDDLQRRYIDSMRVSGLALLRVINDILDYSKMEAGKLDIEFVEFEISQLIDECMELFADKVNISNISLVCHISRDVPTKFCADPVRIRQIILNLLSNAFKFTEQGQVIIKVDLISTNDDHCIIKFRIIDSGIGISKEKRERLFKPFSQADASSTRIYGGTGLGLSICLTLSSLLGGEIGIEENRDSGSDVWFTVLVKLTEKTTNSNQTPIPSHPSHDMEPPLSIIILNENEAVNQVYCDQFKDWNLNAKSATNTQQFEALLTASSSEDKPQEKAPIPIVFIDSNFKQNGLRVGQHLVLAYPNVKRWIYMCPLKNPTNSKAALDKGFTEILELPAGPHAIKAQLSKSPSKESEIDALRPPVASHKMNFSEVHTLVAEDNPVNQIVVKAALKKVGIIPDVANNGKEAVEFIGNGEKRYDLVLMDCEMPIMDGFTATRIIKGLILKKTPYVCGLSAHANQEAKDKGFDAGMDHYLTKPLNRQELYDLIEIIAESPSDESNSSKSA